MNHKSFAKKVAAQEFGRQADRKKFNKAKIEDLIRYSFLAGACEAMLEVTNAYNEDREVDLEVYLGEIQMIYKKYGDEFLKYYPTVREFKIDDLMKHMGFMK